MKFLFRDKKIVAFDVDGTLSPSRLPMDQEMSRLFYDLLKKKNVAIITGGTFERINEQILKPLNFYNKNRSEPKLENLVLLPTNGGGFYIFNRGWKEVANKKLKISEKEKIINAIEEIDRLDYELHENTPYGEEIQDRGSEITYSALGDQAPLELKKAWDPEFKKRLKIQSDLKARLPEFEVKMGGTTSIDITPKGMDKAYAVRQILLHFKKENKDVVFLGDAVYPNGNDYPVEQMGVDTIKVIDPEETKNKIREMLVVM
jgi:HAD superfamily hydrolase (TIGR01484 family)